MKSKIIILIIISLIIILAVTLKIISINSNNFDSNIIDTFQQKYAYNSSNHEKAYNLLNQPSQYNVELNSQIDAIFNLEWKSNISQNQYKNINNEYFAYTIDNNTCVNSSERILQKLDSSNINDVIEKYKKKSYNYNLNDNSDKNFNYLELTYFQTIDNRNIINLFTQINSQLDIFGSSDGAWINSHHCTIDNSFKTQIELSTLDELNANITNKSNILVLSEYLPRIYFEYGSGESSIDFSQYNHVVFETINLEYIYIREHNTIIPIGKVSGYISGTNEKLDLAMWVWIIK
jgi:hypothetical protein